MRSAHRASSSTFYTRPAAAPSYGGPRSGWRVFQPPAGAASSIGQCPPSALLPQLAAGRPPTEHRRMDRSAQIVRSSAAGRAVRQAASHCAAGILPAAAAAAAPRPPATASPDQRRDTSRAAKSSVRAGIGQDVPKITCSAYDSNSPPARGPRGVCSCFVPGKPLLLWRISRAYVGTPPFLVERAWTRASSARTASGVAPLRSAISRIYPSRSTALSSPDDDGHRPLHRQGPSFHGVRAPRRRTPCSACIPSTAPPCGPAAQRARGRGGARIRPDPARRQLQHRHPQAPAASKSRLRNVAASPAASASNATTARSARRASSRACSSVKAVPREATDVFHAVAVEADAVHISLRPR